MIVRTPSSDAATQTECEEAIRDAVGELIAAAVDAGWTRECVVAAMEQVIVDDKLSRDKSGPAR